MNAMTQHTTGTAMQALVPTNISEALQLSEIMAKAKLVPEHLQGKPGDCLLVVMQAQRWGMDVVSVAQSTSVVRGKLCYEGKLVAAVLYAMGAVDGRLKYKFTGSGQNRAITVTGRVRGQDEDCSVEGSVQQWATDNGNWKKNPDDMLVYRGTRQWARRYAPEALLGIYTPDEMEDEPAQRATVVEMPRAKEPAQPQPAAPIAKGGGADTPQTDAGQVVDAEFTEAAAGEPGIHDLSDSQRRLLSARAKAAGLDTDEALLAKYPRIDLSNLNDVLAALRKVAG